MQNNLIDYLNHIVDVCPDKVAYANESEGFTFRQVYEMSRSAATFIAKKGIRRKPVVVFMKKHPKEIIAFLSVITAGCFYVPIDEEMPQSRIDLILENVKAPLLICDESTKEKAKELEDVGECVLFDEISSGQSDDALLKEAYDQAIDTDPVYIVFTSGSTGVPKGVAACHRSVIDYIEQLSETLGFSSETVFGNQTPLYFDACLKEVYPVLKFGATAYLIPKKLFMMPVKLVEFLNEHRINTVCWVVSALTMISSFGTFKTVRPEYLKKIAFGSEVFPIKQFNLWREAVPDAEFTNLYGPTEGTGMSCYYKVDREFQEGDVIPIGRPFKNTEILLLKDRKTKVSGSEEGEICIRGTAVTLGYYNNPEKTKESYIQNPLNDSYPEIIYCTGDIGRYNERGELVFVSRKDYQIKHMGHRIELGEIEANVNGAEGVRMSGCIYDKDSGKIVVFYTGSVSGKDLTTQLRKKLPRYMLPNQMIQLDQMLLTANSKIDRKGLEKLYQEKYKH